MNYLASSKDSEMFGIDLDNHSSGINFLWGTGCVPPKQCCDNSRATPGDSQLTGPDTLMEDLDVMVLQRCFGAGDHQG